MSFLVAYKFLVLARIGRDLSALAMGAIIEKYRPTDSFKNMAICLASFAGLICWFMIAVILGEELF